MSDKDTKDKGKKKKTTAKDDAAATEPTLDAPAKEDAPAKKAGEIGRASCRERV